MKPQEDIVAMLRQRSKKERKDWELHSLLATAADEIEGLQQYVEDLKHEIREQSW